MDAFRKSKSAQQLGLYCTTITIHAIESRIDALIYHTSLTHIQKEQQPPKSLDMPFRPPPPSGELTCGYRVVNTSTRAERSEKLL
jgi:hypothetical protein